MLLLKRLRQAGVIAAASDGPLDLLQRGKSLAAQDRLLLKELIKQYIALRYRGDEADISMARQWRRQVRRFKPVRA
ncbi:MAG: hypothetical protein JO002_02780 [Burkholderiaceae bacterium]|nr:hypothetical protein [Burkholderiaceae bacterium]